MVYQYVSVSRDTHKEKQQCLLPTARPLWGRGSPSAGPSSQGLSHHPSPAGCTGAAPAQAPPWRQDVLSAHRKALGSGLLKGTEGPQPLGLPPCAAPWASCPKHGWASTHWALNLLTNTGMVWRSQNQKSLGQEESLGDFTLSMDTKVTGMGTSQLHGDVKSHRHLPKTGVVHQYFYSRAISLQTKSSAVTHTVL